MEELTCKNCGSPTTNEMKLVTVKTMTDKGFRKTNYYQAMGDLLTVSVCDECIDAYIKQESHPTKRILYTLGISLLIVILGLTFVIFISIGAVKFLGIILVAFSVLSSFQELNRIRKHSKIISTRKNNKTIELELITSLLPKKHNDAELTYIELKRVMKDDLTSLGKEYGVSLNKLKSIRQFLKNETSQ